jgi:hypothetical protein
VDEKWEYELDGIADGHRAERGEAFDDAVDHDSVLGDFFGVSEQGAKARLSGPGQGHSRDGIDALIGGNFLEQHFRSDSEDAVAVFGP